MMDAKPRLDVFLDGIDEIDTEVSRRISEGKTRQEAIDGMEKDVLDVWTETIFFSRER